jgi:DUF971 family protein
MSTGLVPTSITVHRQSHSLELEFESGQKFSLPFELLRVYSPSAEVRGHGPGQEVLQTGKRDVELTALEPVGHYAVQPHFSDGHNTGIYNWEYLHWLGANQDSLWEDYLQRLDDAGHGREAGRDLAMSPAQVHGHGCAH